MPKKPSPTLSAQALDNFGTPSSTRLKQAGVVSNTISKMIADDEAAAKLHRDLVYYGICRRFQLALAIADDKEAFAKFVDDSRVKALARSPKDPSDTLKSLMQATYPDPKQSSKYFKRIEHLWVKRGSVEEVQTFLAEHGISKPLNPTGTIAAPPKAKAVRGSSKAKAIQKAVSDSEEARSAPEEANENDSPCGTIVGWPKVLIVDELYDFRVKITDVDDDGYAVSFELLDASRTRLQ